MTINIYDFIAKSESYPHIEGGEGCAFFIPGDGGEEFVLKKFTKLFINASTLDNYFLDAEKFGNICYSAPKIYSWARIQKTTPKYTLHQGYLLQERIKGRELYCRGIREFYKQNNCGFNETEFNDIMKFEVKNASKFFQIFNEFLRDYINIGNIITKKLSEKDIAVAINDVLYMYQNSHIGSPDIHPTNVLLDENNRLRIIDNSLDYAGNWCARTATDFVVSSFIEKLFWFQRELNLYSKNRIFRNGDYIIKQQSLHDKVTDELLDEENRVTATAMIKILKVINMCLEDPTVSNRALLESIATSIKLYVGDKYASSVINEIQTKFEK